MARKSGRAALTLAPEQKKTLEALAASRTAPAREVERAKVLLGFAAGTSITELQRQLGFSRPMIYRCVDKALASGVQTGLNGLSYGHPADNLQHTAMLLSAYLQTPIHDYQVAGIMVLVKLARTNQSAQHIDNWVDLCSYGALAGQLATEENDLYV